MPGQGLSIAGIIISGVLIAVGLVVSAIATITLVNSSM